MIARAESTDLGSPIIAAGQTAPSRAFRRSRAMPSICLRSMAAMKPTSCLNRSVSSREASSLCWYPTASAISRWLLPASSSSNARLDFSSSNGLGAELPVRARRLVRVFRTLGESISVTFATPEHLDHLSHGGLAIVHHPEDPSPDPT